MAGSKQHRIVVATDGSPAAQAAATTVIRFPWSDTPQVLGIVANFPWLRTESAAAQEALTEGIQATAASVERMLKRRWPTATVSIIAAPPVQAILSAAATFGPAIVAVGWRGHGTFRRLIAGSVSRAVAADAPCSVLVARTAPKRVRRFVVGCDGSPNAHSAVKLLTSLDGAHGCRALLVRAVQPQVVPASAGRISSTLRAELEVEVRRMNGVQRREAQAELDDAAARLAKAGWKVQTEVRSEAPVSAIMGAAEDHRADIIVVGARATSGLKRLLLGSVANAVLNRSEVPVLLVREPTDAIPRSRKAKPATGRA